MKKNLLFMTLFLMLSLSANENYTVYEKEEEGEFLTHYVKVNGIDNPLKLLIGVGSPKVIKLESLNKQIKLLHCFGGDLGTSTLVGYYYTYILNMKTQQIIGIYEYYNDYTQYSDVDKTPQWKIEDNSLIVFQYSDTLKAYTKRVFNY